jgi:hypothetical protein
MFGVLVPLLTERIDLVGVASINIERLTALSRIGMRTWRLDD